MRLGGRKGVGESEHVSTAYAFAIINIILTTCMLLGCLLVVFNVIKNSKITNMVWKKLVSLGLHLPGAGFLLSLFGKLQCVVAIKSAILLVQESYR